MVRSEEREREQWLAKNMAAINFAVVVGCAAAVFIMMGVLGVLE